MAPADRIAARRVIQGMTLAEDRRANLLLILDQR